jgi:hypothetical protein
LSSAETVAEVVVSGFFEAEGDGDGTVLADAVPDGEALSEGKSNEAEGVVDADGVADGSETEDKAVASGDGLTDTNSAASTEVLFLE